MTDATRTRAAKGVDTAISSIEQAVFEAIDARMTPDQIHEAVDKAIEIDRKFQASMYR